MEHTRSCGWFEGYGDTACTCCLKERKALATEQEMHRAWRKRAEEAEADLARLSAEFEISRKACLLYAQASDDWMRRALKAEAVTPPHSTTAV